MNEGSSTMNRQVTFGIITAASRTEPSPPSEITYDVLVELPGVGALTFEGVKPAYRAVDDAEDEIDVFPFPVNRRVLITIEPLGARDDIQIHDQEQPSFKRCE
jgi:hypothetical protein